MEIVVFTNGCFDIIHSGHLDLLRRARNLGTKLIVGINSDASIKKIKGETRPILSQIERAEILSSLRFVDEVRIFDETTPENLIREIAPDVLVKGGDWQKGEIVGADFVEKNGGKVYSMPLKQGFSTSRIIERIRQIDAPRQVENDAAENGDLIVATLEVHQALIEKIIAGETANIKRCGDLIKQTFAAGKKVLICGNGGSAADAQHLAAEFVGRYEKERRAFPSIALTTDTSALTALANDYDFEKIFARQVEAHALENDLLIAISTSGNSPNIIRAIMTAREIGCRTLGLTGANGKKMASLCDDAILVPAQRTARIQEAHIVIYHIWCEMLDAQFAV